jgi:hypothetical protein
VLGIEGSANKVGVGMRDDMQGLSIFRERYWPTPGKHLSRRQGQASCPERQPSIMQRRSSPS